MRIFAYVAEGVSRLGSYRANEMVDLGPGNLLHVLETGGLDALRPTILNAAPLDKNGLRYLPLISRPPKIICVGLNYVDHRAEANVREPARYPDFFARFSSSLIAHDSVIARPAESEALDFEGELAVVIGRTGRRILKKDAMDYVAGYTVFNEASIRDYQFRASQWTWGKNFDATGAFGPELVTPDELPRSVKEGLLLQTRLNGQVVQSASTADLIFDIPALIEMLSESMTLEPGDVLVTGTPGGVGFARNPPLYMRHGDTIEVEIEGLGCLRNQVRDEQPPPARVP